MKILHIIPHYFPSTEFGGSPFSTRNIILAQVKQGHEIDLLTTDVHSPNSKWDLAAEEINPAGYRIIRVKNLSNLIAYRLKFHLAPGLLTFLFANIHKYDVVHLHEYRTLPNLVAALFKWKTKAKIVLQPHGVFKNFGGREIFKDWFDLLFKNVINSSVDEVLAISKKELADFKNEFRPEQLHLLYYGMQKSSRQKVVSFDLPEKFVLFVGRLHHVKKVDDLLKAYKKSRIWQKNISLVIAGNDDGHLAELKKLCDKLKLDKWVHFIGTVSAKEKYALYRRAQVVTYVTHDEPFGIVPLEAASVGCWSIISEQSGVAELTEKFQFADTISGKNISEFAKILVKRGVRKKRILERERVQLYSMNWENYARQLDLIYLEQPADFTGQPDFLTSL